MSIPGWAQSAENWLRANLPGSEWLALAGAAVCAIAFVFLFVLFARRAGLALASLGEASRARAAKASKAPGFRLMICPPPGKRKIGNWINASLREHLPVFSFGAPFSVVGLGAMRGGLETKTVKRARQLMRLADADLFVWSAVEGRGETGLELYGLSRGGGLSAAEARLFTIALPASRKTHNDVLARAMVYLLAKQLQPALSDPQAFRAEKIQLLAAELGRVLDGQPAVSQRLRSEIEADFCASGVRVAEDLGDLTALNQVIVMRRQHLEAASAAADTGLIIQARLDLGRALIVRAERQFDQNLVREAILQLSQAVEGLRADAAIVRAQAASDALFKAQSMIESRKRFSLNFGS
ncbi:hypothetical protein [Hyphomonas sp.]|uniref:hypothetical protein n=1 Tax=Hyphomonas sp. TaxID=87 RepID=UPI00391967D4